MPTPACPLLWVRRSPPLAVAPVSAKDATIHGRDLARVGDTIHSRNFDVTLDGRLLTADEAVYHPDTGVVELKGKVRLNFGKNLRTFPGEVR